MTDTPQVPWPEKNWESSETRWYAWEDGGLRPMTPEEIRIAEDSPTKRQATKINVTKT